MKNFDVNLLKPFIDGTLKTLKIQCSTDASYGKPFLKGEQETVPFDLAGIIGLTCHTFTGSITLCFPEKVFLHLMSNMLGEQFTTITDDLQSGAAELLNIVYGMAKITLNQQNYAIEKAIPTVIRGQKLHTVSMTSAPTVILPFTTAVGDFYIEFAKEDRISKDK